MWLISNKTLVSDSGIFEDFCDCHCHLLPGVDDGIKKQEDALYILDQWELLGMEEVWMTPHVMEDIPNETMDLTERFKSFCSAYTGQLRLHLAVENMMDGLFLQRLDERDLLPLGMSGIQLLVETSYFNPPMGMEDIVRKIKEAGYTPVLAHPERYQYMDMEHYMKWKNAGMLFQLNIPSLVGAYGIDVQKKAEMLLSKNMYDCSGTDIHSVQAMNFMLNSKISKKTVKAVKQISEK